MDIDPLAAGPLLFAFALASSKLQQGRANILYYPVTSLNARPLPASLCPRRPSQRYRHASCVTSASAHEIPFSVFLDECTTRFSNR